MLQNFQVGGKISHFHRDLPRPRFEQCKIPLIPLVEQDDGWRWVRGCLGNFTFTPPATPTPHPEYTSIISHFLFPPQNRLLHGTAAPNKKPATVSRPSDPSPFYIGALVHRSASASSTMSYTTMEPVHLCRRTPSTAVASPAPSSTVSDLLPGSRRQVQQQHHRRQ